MYRNPRLYVNPDGFEVTRHSYSGSSTYQSCPRLYYLERVAGWHEKQERAARYFGTCVEHAIKLAHTAADLSTGPDFLADVWNKYKNENLVFSKLEGDWDSMLLTGREMLRLYSIFYPNTGFDPMPQFQVFHKNNINGIEFRAYLDMVVQKEDKQAIWDCKVSGASTPSLIGLDPQLRSYAWITGISTVGFLWFQKVARKITDGADVTLLKSTCGLSSGEKVYVLGEDGSDAFAHKYYVTPNIELVQLVETKFKGVRKVEEKLAKEKFISDHSVSVSTDDVTRQRLSLDMAEISEDSQQDIGRQIAEDILRIQFSDQNNYWPMQSGVRFPHDKCTTCVMRGICSGNDKLRDDLVTRGKTLDKKGFDIIWGDE